MPVKVLPQPPAVEKPALSQCQGDNTYRERYHDNREQGELVDNRIYVGGLGYRIEEQDLFYFFETFGPVQHAGIITDGGYSKGYGFVTFHCKEVVNRLLNTDEGQGLVLKGRNLYVGPARQRHGQHQYYGRGRGQGLRRCDDDLSQGENSPGKESSENPDAAPIESSHPQQTSYDPLVTDPGICYPYDASAQPPCCPEPGYPVSFPIYYPQYPAYPTTNPDMAWYPATQYQDMAMVSQDPYTGQVYPIPTPPYPVSYSSTPEGSYPYPLVVPLENQFQPSGPYWPEQPTLYPVIYPYTQPAPQYTNPGEIFQPVPGFQDQVPPLLDSSATQKHDDQNSNNQPGYPDDQRLGDSGFQDSNSGYLDSTSCQDQQHDQSKQAAHVQGGQSQDIHHQGERDLSQSNKPSSKSSNPPRFQQQKASANFNQGPNYTKLKPPENDRNIAVENRGFNNRGGGRDSRVYPSPYKSFSPFTGNLPPRQFPFPAGPRPYFPAQGRGRGRIWGGGYNNAGRRGENLGWSGPKKKQGKKGGGNDNQKIGSKENTQGPIGLSGNQPDLLQGPLEKLEIK